MTNPLAEQIITGWQKGTAARLADAKEHMSERDRRAADRKFKWNPDADQGLENLGEAVEFAAYFEAGFVVVTELEYEDDYTQRKPAPQLRDLRRGSTGRFLANQLIAACAQLKVLGVTMQPAIKSGTEVDRKPRAFFLVLLMPTTTAGESAAAPDGTKA